MIVWVFPLSKSHWKYFRLLSHFTKPTPKALCAYLCSEGGSGCDHGGCWSGARLQKAQKALLVLFLTRSEGSVPQTSWWSLGQAGLDVPVTRSSCCRCRCWKERDKKKVCYEYFRCVVLIGGHITNKDNNMTLEIKTVAFLRVWCFCTISYHKWRSAAWHLTNKCYQRR